MQVRLIKVSDTIDPDLALRVELAGDKVGLHRAMGLGVVSLAKRAFLQPALRPTAWPAKKDGSPATLRKSGTLAKSVRMVSATAGEALVGSDRHYAAIHQLGGETAPHVIKPKRKKALAWPGMKGGPFASVKHPGSKIPARPYLPFFRDGRPTQRAITNMESILRAKLDKK
ncbi:phage gpG-like protein [Haloferula luteola]|uniref:Phage gpG-like protein n=1 Tax=Haloferula luteola TaxID=595692 RepID=A0A840VBB4_9BACT|nr:phage virion morphogenesis protein [Haloferula luteola]MBB5351099.1 phage gpG-like protein [Haloferula luteola]